MTVLDIQSPNLKKASKITLRPFLSIDGEAIVWIVSRSIQDVKVGMITHILTDPKKYLTFLLDKIVVLRLPL